MDMLHAAMLSGIVLVGFIFWIWNRIIKGDNRALAMKDVEVYYFKELSGSTGIKENPFMSGCSPDIIELVIVGSCRNGRISEYRLNKKESLDQLATDRPSKLLLIKSHSIKPFEIEYFEMEKGQRIGCEKIIKGNEAILFALPAYGTPSRIGINLAGVRFNYWLGESFVLKPIY